MTAPPLANLINVLTKLPGVGAKSASRIAYHILKRTPAEAEELASAILDVKAKVFRCSNCNNMTDVEPCAICSDSRRDPAVICVVEEAHNIMAIEKTRMFSGMYHVLGGSLSPLSGRGPEQLKIKTLIERLKGGGVEEIIMATNPTLEGEATAMYLAERLESVVGTVSRIARGLPVGGDLEYADEVTLIRALQGRRAV